MLSLLQAIQQGNGLSAALAGIGTLNSINTLVNGPDAEAVVPGQIGLGLGALASGLNLLDALDAGDTLGAVAAGATLASQGAALWASSLASDAAKNLVSQTAASDAAALSNTLGNVAGVLSIANSLANGDPLGAGIAAITMVNPPLGIVLSVARAVFGGLFGGGEDPYVWINATGEAYIVRTEDGGYSLDVTGTNRYKSTGSTPHNAGTEGGQAVASAMNGLLGELQAQIAQHNAANPDDPGQQWALVPERLPSLYYNAPAYTVQWTDAETGETRSIAVSRTNLAEDLLAVAQNAQAVVPQWLADTLTEKIEAGDATAWKTPLDTHAESIPALSLNLGSTTTTTVLSDVDGDGWLEAHTWDAQRLYLSLDVGGDGSVEALRDLVSLSGGGANNLAWLDANGDRRLTSADPAFGAVKLWLDTNGDAVQQTGEAVGLAQAGIAAIDFTTYPPALIDAEGKRLELSEASITGGSGDAQWIDHGIRASAVVGGTLVAHEEGGQILYAEVTHDYSGEEGHTHRETATVDVGDAQLVGEVAGTGGASATVQTEVLIDVGDSRVQSVAAPAPAAGNEKSKTVEAAELRSATNSAGAILGAAPQASAGEALRAVTEQMVRDAENIFIGAGALLTVVAMGAGSAQAAESGAMAGVGAIADEGDGAVPASGLAVHALTLDELTSRIGQVQPEPPTSAGATVSEVLPPLLLETATVVATGGATAVGGGSPVSSVPATTAAAPAGNADAAVVATPVPGGANTATSGQKPATDEASPSAIAEASATSTPIARDLDYGGYQPTPVDDVLDDRGEDRAFRVSSAQLLANDTSTLATDLAVSAVGGAVHGRVELLADGDIVFTPDADYFGPASFSYTVRSANSQTAQGRVSFEILNENDAPNAVGEQAVMAEDTALLIDPALLLLNDSDVDNDHGQLSIAAVDNASHGTVVLQQDGKILFTPEADYFGEAGFDYTVADGSGGFSRARVNLSIANVNDAPVAAGEIVDTEEDTALSFDQALLLANDADIDNDHVQLFISAVDNAEHGTVALQSDGRILFTPDADYFGSAGFDYTVADGSGGFTRTRVSLAIAAVNDAPVAVGEAMDAEEDTTLLFDQALLLANDSDVDDGHERLFVSAVDNASHGTVALLADGRVVFTPDADYFGAAGFDYTVADGNGGFAQARVDLSIANVNDAPEVVEETLSIDEDTVLTLTQAALLANDRDADGDALSIVAVAGASHGSVALLGNGDIRFTPDADYHGAAGFDYTVADGNGGFSQAHASLDYAAVNDAPVAAGESWSGKGNVPVTFTQAALLANDHDVDGDPLAISSVFDASHGTVSLQGNGDILFTPQAGYYGTAGFGYFVSDGAGGQAQAYMTIDLVHANVAPIAVDDGFTGYEDTPFVIAQSSLLANDSDEDNDHGSLYVSAVGNASHGTVVMQSDGSVVFTPTADYYGAASFSYTVADGDGGETQATAYLDVQSVNDAPVIVGLINFTDAGNAWTVNAYDPDGDSGALLYSLEISPAHGQVDMNGYWYVKHSAHQDSSWDWIQYTGLISYRSTYGDSYSGADPFEIRVTDAEGASTFYWISAVHHGTTSGGGGGGGCPIAIDLNGDGVQLVAPDDSNVFADINGDGWRDRIGWIGAEDGLLALDRDGNGRVDGLDEITFSRDLPGVHTDLQGLAAHDSDGDGYLSAADAEWSRFGIWQDANGNGVQEDGEFQSLEALGVSRIALAGDGDLHVDQGNVVFGQTTVEMKNGDVLAAADVMFAGAGVAYPDAVQAALAAREAVPTAVAATVTDGAPATVAVDWTSLDEAELARQALAFLQAAAIPADPSSPLAFVEAEAASLAATVPAWESPAASEQAVPA